MFRRLAVMAFIVLSFAMLLWSTGVLAEEKADKSREAQIQELKGKIQELKSALEREDNDEKAAELKKAIQEHENKVERLIGESREAQKPKGESPEIQERIKRANANLTELRQAVKVLNEGGGDPEKLKELQEKISQEERKLVELKEALKKRGAEEKQKVERPGTRLMFFPLEHADAQGLSKLIKQFLTPAGIVAADPDTNILVVKDTPGGLEMASAIIKNLDIPRRRGIARDQPRRQPEQRERGEQREEVFFGRVLEAGKQSLTIETRDSKEKVTLYVPVQRRDDGTEAPNEELSAHVSSLAVGSNVRVQWRQGDGERRLILRVSRIEE